MSEAKEIMNRALGDILQKRAIDVTVEELADVICSKLANNSTEKNTKKMLKGIAGIQEIFHCCKSKASKIRRSGILDPAITQTGRDFLIDSDKALELMNKKRR